LTERILADDNGHAGWFTKCPKSDPETGQEGEKMNFENARKIIGSITDIGMALLALAIVASLLVGPSNMSFLGDVVTNVTNLVKTLGSAGLAGLISLGVVLWLIQNK
jgi:hypothetical protein